MHSVESKGSHPPAPPSSLRGFEKTRYWKHPTKHIAVQTPVTVIKTFAIILPVFDLPTWSPVPSWQTCSVQVFIVFRAENIAAVLGGEEFDLESERKSAAAAYRC